MNTLKRIAQAVFSSGISSRVERAIDVLSAAGFTELRHEPGETVYIRRAGGRVDVADIDARGRVNGTSPEDYLWRIKVSRKASRRTSDLCYWFEDLEDIQREALQAAFPEDTGLKYRAFTVGLDGSILFADLSQDDRRQHWSQARRSAQSRRLAWPSPPASLAGLIEDQLEQILHHSMLHTVDG